MLSTTKPVSYISMERVCKQISRQVIRFVSEIEVMNEEDLIHVSQLSGKRQDREKPVRVGRLQVNAYK